jgi:integrase/recombinase XerD
VKRIGVRMYADNEIVVSVGEIVSRAAKRAGIPKAVSCHGLRQANASHSLDNQAPLHLVQATLGHSSIASTGRYLLSCPTDSTEDCVDV